MVYLDNVPRVLRIGFWQATFRMRRVLKNNLIPATGSVIYITWVPTEIAASRAHPRWTVRICSESVEEPGHEPRCRESWSCHRSPLPPRDLPGLVLHPKEEENSLGFS